MRIFFIQALASVGFRQGRRIILAGSSESEMEFAGVVSPLADAMEEFTLISPGVGTRERRNFHHRFSSPLVRTEIDADGFRGALEHSLDRVEWLYLTAALLTHHAGHHARHGRKFRI